MWSPCIGAGQKPELEKVEDWLDLQYFAEIYVGITVSKWHDMFELV